jgi:hypothetical protein
MPIFDITFLATIVILFTTFGIVLAGVTWYCSDKRKRPVDHRGHRRYRSPTGADVIVDDQTASASFLFLRRPFH